MEVLLSLSFTLETFKSSCDRSRTPTARRQAVMEGSRNNGGSKIRWKFAGMMEVLPKHIQKRNMTDLIRSAPYCVLSANELNQLCVLLLCAFSSLPTNI